jgi:hypothetical protein
MYIRRDFLSLCLELRIALQHSDKTCLQHMSATGTRHLRSVLLHPRLQPSHSHWSEHACELPRIIVRQRWNSTTSRVGNGVTFMIALPRLARRRSAVCNVIFGCTGLFNFFANRNVIKMAQRWSFESGILVCESQGDCDNVQSDQPTEASELHVSNRV